MFDKFIWSSAVDFGADVEVLEKRKITAKKTAVIF